MLPGQALDSPSLVSGIRSPSFVSLNFGASKNAGQLVYMLCNGAIPSFTVAQWMNASGFDSNWREGGYVDNGVGGWILVPASSMAAWGASGDQSFATFVAAAQGYSHALAHHTVQWPGYTWTSVYTVWNPTKTWSSGSTVYDASSSVAANPVGAGIVQFATAPPYDFGGYCVPGAWFDDFLKDAPPWVLSGGSLQFNSDAANLFANPIYFGSDLVAQVPNGLIVPDPLQPRIGNGHPYESANVCSGGTVTTPGPDPATRSTWSLSITLSQPIDMGGIYNGGRSALLVKSFVEGATKGFRLDEYDYSEDARGRTNLPLPLSPIPTGAEVADDSIVASLIGPDQVTGQQTFSGYELIPDWSGLPGWGVGTRNGKWFVVRTAARIPVTGAARTYGLVLYRRCYECIWTKTDQLFVNGGDGAEVYYQVPAGRVTGAVLNVLNDTLTAPDDSPIELDLPLAATAWGVSGPSTVAGGTKDTTGASVGAGSRPVWQYFILLISGAPGVGIGVAQKWCQDSGYHYYDAGGAYH